MDWTAFIEGQGSAVVVIVALCATSVYVVRYLSRRRNGHTLPPKVCLWCEADVIHLRDIMAKWERHEDKVAGTDEWVKTQGESMRKSTEELCRGVEQFLTVTGSERAASRRVLQAISASLKEINAKVKPRA